MEIVGKGKKLRMVALPVNLREKLESYAYRARIEPGERFFKINGSPPKEKKGGGGGHLGGGKMGQGGPRG